MTTRHPLDRPVWNALTGPQAHLAIAQGAAVRIDPAYGPFAAARDDGAEATTALVATLGGTGDGIGLVERVAWPPPPGTGIVMTGELVQMLRPAAPPPAIAPTLADGIITLDEHHAPAMAALAHATEPGPWAALTHRFGRFYGVFRGATLVAMAGTRMRVNGYTEVSGVCTDPAWRGAGLAGALVARVLADIAAGGDAAFLHAYAGNAGAIRLYEGLGFKVRREMVLTVLARL